MNLYYVHPSRKREVWYNFTKLFGFIPIKIKKAVYWNINSQHAMSWPMEIDRKTEPYYTSLYSLMEYGWKRE